MPQHRSIAFKCTFNDGDEGFFVGFNGTCTIENIIRNIRGRRVWCSQPECECNKYLNRNFTNPRPSFPCLESALFHDWQFGAGTWHHGPRAGRGIRIREATPGKFAIFTTRFPGEPEDKRRIIGLFKISEVNEPNGETVISAGTEGRIRLPLEESKELYYWAYATTSDGTPHWREGLFRYLEDDCVHRILTDIQATVSSPLKKSPNHGPNPNDPPSSP